MPKQQRRTDRELCSNPLFEWLEAKHKHLGFSSFSCEDADFQKTDIFLVFSARFSRGQLLSNPVTTTKMSLSRKTVLSTDLSGLRAS